MHEVEYGIEVADVYAAALYALADEAGVVDDVREELEELVKVYRDQPQFASFMASDSVDEDEREKSLEKMFRGRLSDNVLNTLQVMNQHGRAGLLPALLRAYVLRIEDARGQIEVSAISAVALTDDEKAQVERVAEQLSGKVPLLEYVVDPEILGGLILQIGDYRFDNSLRRQLFGVREQLLERSDRGLGIGVDGDPTATT